MAAVDVMSSQISRHVYAGRRVSALTCELKDLIFGSLACYVDSVIILSRPGHKQYSTIYHARLLLKFRFHRLYLERG